MDRKSKNLTEEIYAKLKNQILNGEIKPGTPLREESLATQLGVSRTPVRTALKMLFSEKLLTEGKNRMLRVASVFDQNIEEVFLARRIIDMEIVELACRRRKPEHIDKLMHYIEDEKLAYETRNTILIIHAERLFHNYIGEISGNELLQQFQETINNRVLLILALSSTLEDEVGTAIEEHIAIVKALKDGDPYAARKFMLEHLSNVETRIREKTLRLFQHQEKGPCCVKRKGT